MFSINLFYKTTLLCVKNEVSLILISRLSYKIICIKMNCSVQFRVNTLIIKMSFKLISFLWIFHFLRGPLLEEHHCFSTLVRKQQVNGSSALSFRGQQFAQQIQQQNPELIEQLRNHIRSRSFSGSAEEHSWSIQVLFKPNSPRPNDNWRKLKLPLSSSHNFNL